MLGIVRAAALMLLVIATPVRATVRVLMVGIDRYAFSVSHDPSADPKFHDLKGAVNDVETLRATLAAKARLTIAPVTRGCSAVTPTSTILINDCAPRAAILAAWVRIATASSPGDTLLFYYSGHGSTVNDISGTQESGSSDTLVPYDARGRAQNPEILDLDLRALIDAATARGINIVTIFDSCNSGTATRAFSSDVPRAIPPGHRIKLRASVPPPPAAHPGYRVHLSAAGDGQTAIERKGHGLFTGALAGAIAANPDASYGDLIGRVRATLKTEPQTAGAEGALTARFLGPPPPPGRFFTGRVIGDAVVLGFGTLSLVTPGSRFALFASSSAAARTGAKPLTTGTVTLADSHHARITPAIQLPQGEIFAAELEHDYGIDAIRIALDGTSAQRSLVTAALASTPATVGAEGAGFIAHWSGTNLQLLTATSPPTKIYDSLGAPAEKMTAGLKTAVARIADYRALLTLQQVAGEPKARLRFFTGACTSTPDQIAPAKIIADEPTLVAGRPSYVLVANMSGKPLNSYLFALNHDFGVFSLNPPGADKPIAPYPARSRCQDLRTQPGRGTLFAVLSEEPLDADALAQNGGARSFDGCAPGTLAYLLCKARRHTRGFGPDTSVWTVASTTTNVLAPGAAP